MGIKPAPPEGQYRVEWGRYLRSGGAGSIPVWEDFFFLLFEAFSVFFITSIEFVVYFYKVKEGINASEGNNATLP